MDDKEATSEKTERARLAPKKISKVESLDRYPVILAHILRHLHEFNKALLRMLTFCRTWCHRDSKYNIAAGVIVFHGFYTRV